MIELKINYVSSTPLHRQVEDRLLKAIKRGEINKGARLPSVISLSKKLSLAEVIVERAYRKLTKEHILLYQKGDGYFVGEKSKSL